ncbi:MAG: hypothetical protein ACQ5SW_11090 [Sphaerochaetaceae bacterium]
MAPRKKRKKPGMANPWILLTILALLVVCIALPYLLHVIQPARTLVISIYDKTVPTMPALQHEWLSWFLSHYKFPTSDDLIVVEKQERYLGYHPEQQQTIRDLSALTEQTDLLYIADTYGIYKTGEGFIRNQAERRERNLIWGGLDDADVRAIRTFLNREASSTLIAEYNTFATPTPPHVQAQMYELLGTRWTGWTGMYVHDFSDKKEIPSWIQEMYAGAWDYTGSGIILYNIHDEVIVLPSSLALGPKELQFSYTEQGTSFLNLSDSTAYEMVFDITEPLEGTEVLATFTLDLTERGKSLLRSYGLSATFPAIQLKETANHRVYYLSGNWAYNNRPLRFSNLKGMQWFMEKTASQDEAFYWKQYLPLLSAIFQEAEQRKSFQIPELTQSTTEIGQTKVVARATSSELLLFDEGAWKPFFVYGMNLGTAMPGKWFTEFPKDTSLYYRYLEQMGNMGINTIRIYTLLDPQFYEAFSLYNRLHPNTPIYLMQEVWPEEEPPGHDYLRDAYRWSFEEEICNVVDAIHGNANIPERRGRAYGIYRSDVSSYVIGYLVGRELEPHEVEETDLQHKGYRFTGSYISTTEEATPTESWLAQSCNYLLSYEEETYGWQHPVAIVNWPTLDYLTHESERDESSEKKNEYNDRTTVNINHLLLGDKNKAGLFGAYHIYPNYPDFMNNEPSFDAYEDEEGRFRYGGYLRAFMEGHRNYPAVVAEFGIATGMGNAHANPDGYHHGGLSEQDQGEMIIRMFEAMEREGYSGGIIFEWMDEWAKKTWTTEPYMIPYDRQILWHNAIDPEQNYGILANEAVKPKRSTMVAGEKDVIKTLEIRSDASFLWFDVTFSHPLDLEKEQLIIGIDTLYRDRGGLKYLPDLPYEASSGMEYIVLIDSWEDARLLALDEANYTRYHFSTSPNLRNDGLFTPLTKLINKKRMLENGVVIEPRFEDASHLRYGDLKGTTNHWHMVGDTLTIRIPWTRINISDPSSLQVLDDERRYYSDPLRDTIATSTIKDLLLSILVVDKQHGTISDRISSISFSWNPWNQPMYQQRLKQSYEILQTYFHEKRGIL